MIPYLPLYHEYDVPHYDLKDIEIYGTPDIYGIYEYSVIDNPEHSCPLILEWKDEMALKEDGVNIHYYDRHERFKSTLYQLIGGSRVIIPQELYNIIKNEYNPDPKKVWNSVRSLLKKYGFTKFYNRIPCILKHFNYEYKIIRIPKNSIRNVLNDFYKINEWFENSGKKDFNMKYFPNIRYIVLKLMDKNGIKFDYDVPFIRVKKVNEKYQELWEMIELFVF